MKKNNLTVLDTADMPKTKHSGQHFSTRDFDWSFDTHGAGAIVKAVDQILSGAAVSFDCFTSGEESTDLIFEKTEFIGIGKDEDGAALRVSHCKDLYAHNSHSIIPTWYGDRVINPVLIAATIATYFKNYRTFFINQP